MAYLASYLPGSVLSFVVDQQVETLSPPMRHDYETVVLFADVSGYTAMCEAMSQSGPGGEEHLAKNLNSYFELLIRAMSGQGGDVFKFAGDAILVVWPPSNEPLDTLVRRATQCGLEIRASLQDAVLSHGVRLSVKIGIGAGKIGILHLGGVYNRLEYLAIGEPLVQAFNAEHHATKTELVVSPFAWGLIKDHFKANVLDDGYAFINECENPLRKVGVVKSLGAKTAFSETVVRNMCSYIPTAVIPFATQNDDKWVNELRHITVLFVNLGVREAELINMNTEKDVNHIHAVLKAVQKAVYKYEGSLNKFLMDDKGSTLIAIFGLPPLAHEDDAVRGVLGAQAIITALHQLDLRPSIGITTGQAFCGVVGARGRREYSVLGDTVNLSARLMQHATVTGADVLMDSVTWQAARRNPSKFHDINYYDLGTIAVKGKTKPVTIYQPVLKRSVLCLEATHLERSLEQDKQQEKEGGPALRDDAHLWEQQKALLAFLKSQDRGAAAVVIGEPGLGKSKMVMAALRAMPARFMLVCSAGNPYDVASPLKAVASVFVQLVARTSITNVRAWVRTAVASRAPYAAVLNDVLSYDFEETPATVMLDTKGRLAEARAILVTLMKAVVPLLLVCDRIVVLLEDAHHLDAQTWQLVLPLTLSVPKLVLVFVTRPLDKTYMCAFAEAMPPVGFEAMLKSDRVKVLTMLPRDEGLIYRVAAQSLEPTSKKVVLAKALGELIVDRSRGNPRIAAAMVRHLQAHNLITVNPDGKVEGTAAICPSKREINAQAANPKGLTTPLPSELVCSVGARLDRLSLTQQMLLKVAAVIGNEFSLDLVEAGYPLEDNTAIGEAINGLIGWKVLHRVADQYRFCSGIFRHIILQRMLTLHQDTLVKKIKAHRDIFTPKQAEEGGEDHAESVRRFSISGAKKKFPDSIMEGVLRKQGGRLKTWKSRYFVLYRDKLSYYESIKCDTTKGPKGEIPLGIDTLTEAPDAGSSAFILTPSIGGHRRYEFVAKDNSEAQQWVDALAITTKLRAKQFREKQASLQVGFRLSEIQASLEANITTEKVFKDSIKEAWMMKRGDSIKTWKKRFFVLHHDKLQYYTTQKTLKNVKGEISISPVCVVEKVELPCSFAIIPTPNSRRYFITCKSEEDATEWIDTITKLTHNATGSSAQPTKMANHSAQEGYLQKKGGTLGLWASRYFVLFNSKLQYFVERNKPMTGEFPIYQSTTVELGDAKLGEFTFIVKPNPADSKSKTYVLKARDQANCDAWIAAIKTQLVQAPKLPC